MSSSPSQRAGASGASTAPVRRADDFRPAGLIRALSPRHFHTDSLPFRGGDDRGAFWELTVDLAFDESIPSMSEGMRSGFDLLWRHAAAGYPVRGYEPNAQPTLEKIRGNWTLCPEPGQSDIDEHRGIGPHHRDCGKLFRVRLADPASAIRARTITTSPSSSVGTAPIRAMSHMHSADGVRGFALAYPIEGGGMQMVIASWIGWDGLFFAAARKR